MNTQKTRRDIPANRRWDLRDIFRDKRALLEYEKEIDRLSLELAGLKGKAAGNPLKAVKLSFDLSRLQGSYFTFSRMQQDQDVANPAFQAQMAKAEARMVQVRSAGAFLEPELLTLSEETLTALENNGDFPQYRMFFHDLLRKKPHVLPKEQEELLAQSGEVYATASRVFNVLNNADLPLPETVNEKGEKERLTHARYNVLIRSHDREVRRSAFTGMMNAYGSFSSTLSSLYVSSVRNDTLQARVRKYASAREASLSAHEIPLSVYDGLLRQAEKAFPLLDRYLELRKKALGVNELHLYDLYVPIARDFSMQIAYPEAFRLVRRGLKPLGDGYAQLLDRAFRERWIDVYETKGKRTGAYSWGTYDSHPYVLLNHMDTLDGAMTLAHELGHAMHSFHSNQAQPYEQAGYSLFAAEVASTCNEVLLNRALLEEYKGNRGAQLFFLTCLAEDFRTTFFRQTMFAEFEHEAHRLSEKGVPLTGESLSGLYEALNRKYYGRICVIDKEIRHEWMRIPHFYRAFYVYQYATGFSAAVFLASRILKEGGKATQDYFHFLSSGGSLPPIQALQQAGADMAKPGVIRGAMKVFEETLSEMEQLVQP